VSVPIVESHESGDRHPWLEVFCTHLQDMLVSRNLPEREDVPDGLYGLVVLPMWTYLEPRINVGPKADRGLIPARLEWREAGARDWSDPVVVAAIGYGYDRALEWRATGLGYGTTTSQVPMGCTIIECGAEEMQSGWDPEGGVFLPTRVVIPYLTGMDADNELRELRFKGEESRWMLTDMLQKPAERAAEKACRRVSWEVSGFDHVHPVIDEEMQHQVADELLYGLPGRPTSHVLRILDRCLLPSTFLRVEPHHYVRESLRRDAIGIIRRMIGDPHVGPKVRRIFREDSPVDIDDLVRRYREQYPHDQLSRDRALRAITAGHDVMSTHLPTDPTGERLILPREWE